MGVCLTPYSASPEMIKCEKYINAPVAPRYMEHYEYVENQMRENRLRIADDYKKEHEDAASVLGFQHKICAEFNGSYKYNQNQLLVDSYTDEEILKFYCRNALHLQAALNCLESYDIHSSASILRVVHEAIPKMYYLSLNPNEIDDLIISEGDMITPDNIIKVWRAKNRKRARDNATNNSGSNKLKKKKTKYTATTIREKLYEGKRKEKISGAYGMLSTSVHSNSISDELESGNEHVRIRNFFDCIKILSCFNIAALLEGTYNSLGHLKAHNDSLKYVNELKISIGEPVRESYFLPNKEGVSHRLNLQEDPSGRIRPVPH